MKLCVHVCLHMHSDDARHGHCHQRGKRNYSLVRKRQREAWSKLLPSFVRVTTENFVLATALMCFICNGPATMRCLDCGPLVYYCESCCQMEHQLRNIYHTPEWWDGYRYIAAPLIKLDHNCFSSYVDKLTVVGLNRMYRNCIFECHYK